MARLHRRSDPHARTIDVHAHVMPQCFWRTVPAGRAWYGTRYEPGEGPGTIVSDGKRSRLDSPKVTFTPEERLRDMDAQAWTCRSC